jgi:hypothetical protein
MGLSVTDRLGRWTDDRMELIPRDKIATPLDTLLERTQRVAYPCSNLISPDGRGHS